MPGLTVRNQQMEIIVTDDPFEIPDFLLVKNRVKCDTAAVKIKKQRAPRRKKVNTNLPRQIEPAGLVLLAEIEKQKKLKLRERLAMLRERRK